MYIYIEGVGGILKIIEKFIKEIFCLELNDMPKLSIFTVIRLPVQKYTFKSIREPNNDDSGCTGLTSFDK